jgi:ABC-type glutathione transport system ATPase component
VKRKPAAATVTQPRTEEGSGGVHPEASAHALSVRDLSIRIRGRFLVHAVDLSIPAGGRLALLGASGSGKTLTAAAVAGCLPVGVAVGGSVHIGGVSVLDTPAARRSAGARAGMVFQDSATALNPMVRIGRQLREPLTRRGLSRPAAAAGAARLLAGVGLRDTDRVLRSHPSALSGGQRQRVCLALALACEVPLLVADEPTTALDVLTQAAVVDLLRARTGGNGPALLFITHDIAVAAQLCDEIAVMDAGTVVERGPAHRIVHAPTHPVTQRLVAAAQAVESDLRSAAVGRALTTRGAALTSGAAS